MDILYYYGFRVELYEYFLNKNWKGFFSQNTKHWIWIDAMIILGLTFILSLCHSHRATVTYFCPTQHEPTPLYSNGGVFVMGSHFQCRQSLITRWAHQDGLTTMSHIVPRPFTFFNVQHGSIIMLVSFFI